MTTELETTIEARLTRIGEKAETVSSICRELEELLGLRVELAHCLLAIAVSEIEEERWERREVEGN